MKPFNRRIRTAMLTGGAAAMLTAVYVCGLFLSKEAASGSFLEAGQPPSWAHPFGTDALGRDLLCRTLSGLSVSLTIGMTASLISAVIAVLIGTAAAGPKVADAFFSWCIDLVMSVPHTILVILISFVMGRGLKGLLIGIAVTHWCSLARLIRGEVLRIRAEDYVEVSRRLGKSNGWILRYHLLPHLIPQLIVGVILMLPHAILHEASVSFLGFGLSPEQPSIGIILSESMRYLSAGQWWPAVLPGLSLVTAVLLLDALGEHLRLLLDPQSAQE